MSKFTQAKLHSLYEPKSLVANTSMTGLLVVNRSEGSKGLFDIGLRTEGKPTLGPPPRAKRQRENEMESPVRLVHEKTAMTDTPQIQVSNSLESGTGRHLPTRESSQEPWPKPLSLLTVLTQSPIRCMMTSNPLKRTWTWFLYTRYIIAILPQLSFFIVKSWCCWRLVAIYLGAQIAYPDQLASTT